jgi:hypothetical protein
VTDEHTENYEHHVVHARYDPDEIWPTRWVTKVYHLEQVGPPTYCRTLHSTTKDRAVKKGRRYVDRRIRRILSWRSGS